MSPSSRLNRGAEGRTSHASSIPGPLAKPTDDRKAQWLPTVAFFAMVALLHWLFIRVSLSDAVEAFPLVQRRPHSVGLVSTVVPRMAALLPAVALLYFLQRRFGLVGGRGSVVRTAVALLVAATLEWALFLGGVTLVDRWCGTDTMAFIPAHAYGIGYRVMVLGVGMLLFALGTQWRRVKSLELRTAEAEAALRTSELTRLEAQLQPHFLFNALTAVLACRHDPEAVATVTIGLSEHLRACLSRQGALAPLSREIDALEHYLAVQRARFGRRLDCRIECTPEARGATVPPVIVEPLLDNALKHGAATSADPLRISVDCRTEGGTLVVTVDNSGEWIEPGSNGRRGTGLANLRKRLDLLDVQDASLESGPVAGGVRATLTLPLAALAARAGSIDPVATGGGFG